MSSTEIDPDTLQTLDELDEKWVKRWRKATDENISKTPKVTVIIPQREKTCSQIQQKRHKF